MEPDAGQSGVQSPPETEETQSQEDEEQETSELKQSQSDGEDDVDNGMIQLKEPLLDDFQLPETMQRTEQDTEQDTIQNTVTMHSDSDEASSDPLSPLPNNLASPTKEEKTLIAPPTWNQSQPQLQARTKEKKGKEREVDSVPQIQVPSTPRSTQAGQAAKPNRLSQNRPSQRPGSTTNTSETIRNRDDSRSSPSIDEELPVFDYQDLEAQFIKEIEGFGTQEEELLTQIEQYGRLLNAWAAGAARRDTNRAAKRLKTRERFVQLSEQRLEKKQEHVQEVVDAFQAALRLLGKA